MRSVTIIQTSASDEEIREQIGKIMVEKGFEFKKYKNTDVWKKGTGWLACPQFFNFYTKENKLYIEGWIKYALLPGVYMGESGLNSGFGIALKVGMRKILKEIVKTFKAENTQAEGYMPKEKDKKEV